MRWVVANNVFMVVIAAVIMVVGLVLGVCLKDFTWSARSGSLVVAVGLILISRASIIGKYRIIDVIKAETGLNHLDPEHYKNLGEPVPDWVIEENETRSAVGTWGPIVSFAGTVIWGFGDLLNKIFCFGN